MSGRWAGQGSFSAPEPLAPAHDLPAFNSGVAALDDWLRLHARQNEAAGGSRTFVACAADRVAGYYSLAAGSVLPSIATGRVRRNMPSPVPVVLLGRLAVDRAFQGRGLGSDLLQDAVRRIVIAADIIGVRAILIHAISDAARQFYERHGFRPSPVDPMTLMLTVAEIRAAARGGTPDATA